MSGTPWAMKHRAPRLGEHNAEVYGALSMSGAQLADLQTRGIV
jgi:crotonobetainyl-CoA:carnitine CoA-transferase CaiB-like acyl-CoA transferase